MRKLILAAAAGLMAVAAPAVASAQTGYAGALYSNFDVDGAGDSDAWGVEGSVFFPTSSSLGFEIDAAVVDNENSDTGYALAGHVFTRNDRYLFGGFASFADDDTTEVWTAGLEANKYFDRWTLNGALFYGEGDTSTPADAEAYGVNVGASLFATDNFRIDGNVTWANVDVGAADDDALAFGVGGEYQFAQLPISIGASYTHIELDDANAEADVVGVTVRYNWGGTLYDRDRNGASQAGRIGIGSLFSL